MDDGYDDPELGLPHEAAVSIRARLADSQRGLRQLLIDALERRQSGSGLDPAGLVTLIEERVAREQLGCWYFAALAAQDRAAKTAEALLVRENLGATAHERLAELLSELRAAEAAAERAAGDPEFAAPDTPEAGVHSGSLVDPISYILAIHDHTPEPTARDRILTG